MYRGYFVFYEVFYRELYRTSYRVFYKVFYMVYRWYYRRYSVRYCIGCRVLNKVCIYIYTHKIYRGYSMRHYLWYYIISCNKFFKVCKGGILSGVL